MKFSTTVVAATFLGSAALVSASPKVSLTRVATGVGKGLSHAATFITTSRHGSIGGGNSAPGYSSPGYDDYDSGAYRRALTKEATRKAMIDVLRLRLNHMREANAKRKHPVPLDLKRKEAAARLRVILAQHQLKTTGQTHKRDFDEGADLAIFLRDLEQHIVERGWDEELEILRRDFGDLLVEREVEGDIDARDFDEEVEARNFDEYDLDARGFAEEFDARDFEIEELD